MNKKACAIMVLMGMASSVCELRAVRENFPFPIQYLLCSKYRYFENVFNYALARNDDSILYEKYSKSNASLFNHPLSDGQYPLLKALSEEKYVVALALINLGADVTVRDQENGKTVLHICRNSIIANELIARGALAFDMDINDNTLLHTLQRAGEAEKMAALLLKMGVKVNQANEFLRTALHNAAEKQLTAVIKLLLENGANPLAKDKWGKTPYDLANGRCKRLLRESMQKSYKKPAKLPSSNHKKKEENSSPLPQGDIWARSSSGIAYHLYVELNQF